MLQTIAMTRFAAFLASVFAIVAVLLGTVGVYAVLAFGVAQRRREFAIRLALGAERRAIIGNVIRRAVTLAGAGVVTALLAARLLVDVLSALLVGADAHDGRTFLVASVLMVLVALFAAIDPALRSVGVNLVSELRPS
jgi:ABC-type antimicrobial peptide transport system permease subunit